MAAMKFTTDKVELGYLPTYESLAAELGPAATVCEVGVQDGDSLVMWQHFFPTGTVVGVDIRSTCTWPAGTHKIVCTQNESSLPALLRRIAPEYDLIVDDASHIGWLTRETYDLLFPLVRPGGYYVIEDWMIGFTGTGYDMYGTDMLEMAEGMLDQLAISPENIRAEGGKPVEYVKYRHGQIIVRKGDI